MGFQFEFENGVREDVLKVIRLMKDERVLLWIPDHLIDYYVCLEAVKENGLAIRNVPDEFVDDKLMEVALTQNYKAYGFLNEDNKKKHLKLVSKSIILELMNSPYVKNKY